MKNILLINYTGRKGGGPLDAYKMTRALLELGLPVAVILSEQIENLTMWEDLKLEKLVLIPTYHNILDAAVATVLFPFRQRNYIKRAFENYNVKYIYCPMEALWSSKINRIFTNAKTGIVLHDPKPHSGDEWKNKLQKDAYSEYDYIFVHSKQFVDYVHKKYNKPTSYIQLGTHDIYKYCKNKTKIIEYDPQKINFLFFGRIAKYKGIEILGAAFKKLHDKLGKTITLTIIGSGDFSPYKEQYDALEDVNVINRWIKDEETESVFIGENLICVCPYKDATQSGVCLVAMDYRVPLIASNTGGMSEQVIDGKTGLLVTPSDVDALYQVMHKLATNRQLREKMKNQQEAYMKTMGWDVSAKQLIEAMNIKL